MKKAQKLLLIYVLWTLIGVLSKLPFMAVQHSALAEATASELLSILVHGLRLDLAIAGYLTLLPGLLLVVATWLPRSSWLSGLWKGYFIFVAVILSLAFVSNIALYGYWGFPLDTTPLLYLRTSPADAFASAGLLTILSAILAVILTSWAIAKPFSTLLYNKGTTPVSKKSFAGKAVVSLLLLLLTAALIIPIRGGFGTGTNHTGSVYFSSNMAVNHAAVNPVFSFVESALHHEEIGTRYRFMDADKANHLFAALTDTHLRSEGLKLATTRSDINVILIMLEGFSSYIMDGGKAGLHGVTPCLDSLSRQGLFFSRFYANSFRTDRAIVSILSGIPAQPSMSLMDMPQKTNRICSLARTLGRNGYQTTFYYGGDTDFSNMQSYLVGAGFQRVVSEDDFPSHLRTSKWGVHDEHVFSRVASDLQSLPTSHAPYFKAIMTLSSHEPFDVPYQSGFREEELNAFAYTDSCVGAFIHSLRTRPDWSKTLVLLVPDHLGAYPAVIDNYQLWRYEIPLILTGGAIRLHENIGTIGSQNDIAATLLGLLNIDHSEFLYSKDLLDPSIPHFAFFTFPDAMGMVDERSFILYDNTSEQTLSDGSAYSDTLTLRAKAYLQKLYDDIDSW